MSSFSLINAQQCLKGNCFNGEGVYEYDDKSIYEGSFSDGEVDGAGKFTTSDGETYFGRWDMGKYMGEFALIEDKAEGCVKGNCNNGKGTYIFANQLAIYIGEFKDFEPSGKGKCHYRNGDAYQGKWKNGLFHGKGTFKTQNNSISGTWDKGTLTNSDFTNSYELPILSQRTIPTAQGHRVWAIIIGISDYLNKEPLKYADDDAHIITGFLRSPEGGSLPDHQITRLTDEMATYDNIINAFEYTFSQTKPNDIVLVYLSGHGNPGGFIPFDSDGESHIPYTNILNIIEQSNAQNTLFMADACHAGSLVDEYSLPEGIGFLASSKPEQISLESSALQGGVFSHFIIEGLKGNADINKNHQITVDELHRYVKENVHNYTAEVQTPQIFGDYNPQKVLLQLN